MIATSVEKFALEIRHLQRTEVGEAEEPFSAGQKGSSAMPHKRNPILSENLCGLARIVRANAFAALENVPLWHERDISHSSAERVIGPDSTILVDFMLARFTGVLTGLNVYPEAMAKNLERSQGLIFSQRVLLELAKRGMSREDAYAIVQRCAMKSLHEGLPFKGLLEQDEKIREMLPRKELERLFSLEASLKHVDETFDRVFGKS
jgi:adenylosuccinate lyase